MSTAVDSSYLGDSLATGVVRQLPVEPSPALRRVLVVADLAVLVVVWTAANLLWARDTAWTSAAKGVSGALVIAVAGVYLLGSQQLYLARVANMRMVEQARLLRVSFRLAVAAAALAWALPGPVSPVRVAAGTTASLVGLVASRSVYRAWLKSARGAGRFARPVTVVGIDDHTREVRQLFEEHPELGFTLVAAFGCPRSATRSEMGDVWMGDLDHAVEAAYAGQVTGAVVSTTAIPRDELNRVVRRLLDARCHVYLTTGLSGIDQRRLQPVHLAYEPLIYVEASEPSRRHAAAKRALDVILGSVTVVVVLPVLAVAALAIKLADGGPVLFRQTRVGRNGQLFHLYKLRTMTLDAEARLDDLSHHNERRGPLFKMGDDPRVTRVGRWMRELSIDELPQLWNVLKGDMSLVGPRPALPDEVARFGDRLQERTRVRPGITGLWQVEARDNPSFYAYERLDLFYVDNVSIGLDIVILIATIESQIARLLRRTVEHPGRPAAPESPPRPLPVRVPRGAEPDADSAQVPRDCSSPAARALRPF